MTHFNKMKDEVERHNEEKILQSDIIYVNSEIKQQRFYLSKYRNSR